MEGNFQLLKNFRLVVPKNYNHTSQLDSFRRENSRKFYAYDENITDANFIATSSRLIPGAPYSVKLFGIVERTTSEPCLSFLDSRRAILVSAQGISAVWQQHRQEFPANMWTLSFDVKSALLVEDIESGRSDYMLPYICRSLDGSSYGFGLGRFEGFWRRNCCILCVSEF